MRLDDYQHSPCALAGSSDTVQSVLLLTCPSKHTCHEKELHSHSLEQLKELERRFNLTRYPRAQEIKQIANNLNLMETR